MELKMDKPFWRKARLLLWSFIVAFAALQIFGLVQPPEPIAAFMALVYIVAAWVVAYHLIERVKGTP